MVPRSERVMLCAHRLTTVAQCIFQFGSIGHYRKAALQHSQDVGPLGLAYEYSSRARCTHGMHRIDEAGLPFCEVENMCSGSHSPPAVAFASLAPVTTCMGAAVQSELLQR